MAFNNNTTQTLPTPISLCRPCVLATHTDPNPTQTHTYIYCIILYVLVSEGLTLRENVIVYRHTAANATLPVTAVPTVFKCNDAFVIIKLCGGPAPWGLQWGGCECVWHFPESLPLSSLNLDCVCVSSSYSSTCHRSDISSRTQTVV